MGFFFGPAPFDLRPFVDEAVAELGYFRPDSVDGLVAVLQQLWPSGCSSTMLLYNELEEMSAEEKQAANAPRGRMPREVWSMLSEAGRCDPFQGVKETTTHVILAVQSERARRQRLEHPEL